MPKAHTIDPDEMSAEFYEAVLEAIDAPPWFRNPSVSAAIDKAWEKGLRSVGEVAQEVLKANPRICRMVGGQ
jgi:hypothetical protein